MKPMTNFHVITYQKHQALYCKIPVLIKQQTFVFLGILQVYLQELSMCIFILKAQIFKLAEAVPTSSQKYKAGFHKMSKMNTSLQMEYNLFKTKPP